MISDEDRERVRSATDLVELVQETVELKPRGHEFWGCCPFHGEKTPSFHIIPATQVWHCFGCGEGGDAFSYIMHRENLSFPESIRFLADRAGIEIHDDRRGQSPGTKRNRLVEVCEATAEFYHTVLMRGKDGRGRDYCKQRQLGSDICRRYKLGFAPGRGALVQHLGSLGFTPKEMIDANVAMSRRGGGLVDRFYDRVMFPIFDEQGRGIAFGGRIMGAGEPKYLNTSETPVFHKKKNLYGFNWAKEHIVAANEAVVVEGYMDCIRCWEGGVGNVVATLGTALTEHHVKTLTRFAKRIVYLFDGDAAGQKAAERAIRFVEHSDIDLRCVILPNDMDPDDYVRTYGGPALRDLLDHAEPLMDFVFRKLEQRADTSTPGGRAKALEDALRLIFPLRSSYVVDGYYMQIADRVGVDVGVVRDAAPRVFKEAAAAEARAREREARFERDRAARERADLGYGASGAGAATASMGAGRVADDLPFDEEVPLDAYGAVPVEDVSQGAPGTGGGAGGISGFSVLSDLERRALAVERELLTLLTTYPEEFRPFAERIVDLDWVDGRNEVIAWAVLATPQGTTSADAMGAARAVCPDAAQLVSAGTVTATSAHPTATNIGFILDTLELYTLRRRMKAAQGRLRSDRSLGAQERRDLTIQATRDVARVRELDRALEGVADPFKLLQEGA